jgi:hypothetical protein
MDAKQKTSIAEGAHQMIDHLLAAGKARELCQVFLYLRKIEHDTFPHQQFSGKLRVIADGERIEVKHVRD